MDKIVDYLIDNRQKYQYLLSLVIGFVYLLLIISEPYDMLKDSLDFVMFIFMFIALIYLVVFGIVLLKNIEKLVFSFKVITSLLLVLTILFIFFIYLVISGSYSNQTPILIDMFTGIIVLGMIIYTTYEERYKSTLFLKFKEPLEEKGNIDSISFPLGIVTFVFLSVGTVLYVIVMWFVFFFRIGGV